MLDETSLIQKSRSGDRKAFDGLLRLYQDRLVRLAQKVCAQAPAEADDVVQDTLLVALKKVKDFRGDSSLGTWLFRVASNLCWMRLRKKRRRATDPLPEGPEGESRSRGPWASTDPLDDPAARARRNELRRAVGRALMELPADERAVVVLSDVREMKNEEIAGRLGLTVAAVKSRLHRGRRRLRTHFEKK
ncbi:MAG TPA: sigma-70 family RNA polymerase sigma factor [Elusimicrobiota bacterium]|jgi:RNA polymerase sigma-70 factor (ECF subfamily)|nr:sigma-70 family RNA polymerase sigma factor [Elusimicrobiota bacterium]HNC73408.1 sigma-70 family RNA polymerase sigma factor [Elusimicrobiota bacterium]HND63490.1 sigma-70 family RNA polymerase sigma factor [Elusimicrobiota bacterium]HNG45044.1 sigma-70 family RNA polymerase sigma factor [Elusimicrobiota bacterium]HNI57579.1 sigma-70 family RNA polymerase sigma factor [Elusimicrobiota bacterium]